MCRGRCGVPRAMTQSAWLPPHAVGREGDTKGDAVGRAMTQSAWLPPHTVGRGASSCTSRATTGGGGLWPAACSPPPQCTGRCPSTATPATTAFRCPSTSLPSSASLLTLPHPVNPQIPRTPQLRPRPLPPADFHHCPSHQHPCVVKRVRFCLDRWRAPGRHAPPPTHPPNPPSTTGARTSRLVVDRQTGPAPPTLQTGPTPPTRRRQWTDRQAPDQQTGPGPTDRPRTDRQAPPRAAHPSTTAHWSTIGGR